MTSPVRALCGGAEAAMGRLGVQAQMRPKADKDWEKAVCLGNAPRKHTEEWEWETGKDNRVNYCAGRSPPRETGA